MRARSWGGLVAVVVLAMLLPVSVAAQSGQLEADNPSADCRVPLTETIVSGDLGSIVVVDGTAEIDLVTLDSDDGEVVDVNWDDGGQEATIVTSDDVSSYIVWSCAPMNGEPVQQNDGQDV